MMDYRSSHFLVIYPFDEKKGVVSFLPLSS